MIKDKIYNILSSSEMWTYLMDSYNYPEDEECAEIIEKDFDNIVNEIVKLFSVSNQNFE